MIMKILIVVGIIIAALAALIGLVLLAIRILVRLYDRWAIKAARRYCEENDL